MNSTELRRCGSKYERFPGRGRGYDIIVYDDGTGHSGGLVVGHAVQAIDRWGRLQGWVVLDYHTGETIFGLGDSTIIGRGLSDCLYLYAAKLEASDKQ